MSSAGDEGHHRNPQQQQLIAIGPTKFGVLLYEGFEILDVFGPLEALNVISRPEFGYVTEPVHLNPTYIENISLEFIAQESGLISPKSGKFLGSSPGQEILAQRSITDDVDFDVLLVPGGMGSSDVPDEVVNWLRDYFPKLKFLITVCTGAHLAARAGLLDGLKATTNKQAWGMLKTNEWAHKTYWVAHARWVQSSAKIWTTSGVSAGTDGFIAWIKATYGEKYGELCCKWMEYDADKVSTCDQWSKGLKDIPPVK